MWTSIISSVILLCFCTVTTTSNQNDKLNVKVFYTSWCFFSRKFITETLQPAMNNGSLIKNTDLELYPCQNLEKENCSECKIHSVHACAMKHYDMGVALDIVACTLKDKSYVECGQEFDNFNPATIKACLEDNTQEELLSNYSSISKLLRIRQFPTVVIDVNLVEDWSYFTSEFCNIFTQKFNYTLDACLINDENNKILI